MGEFSRLVNVMGIEFSSEPREVLSHKSDSRRKGGEARARCSLYPQKFLSRACGRKINYQTYYTTKSLPDLTIFLMSNYFKSNIRYKISIFAIYSIVATGSKRLTTALA